MSDIDIDSRAASSAPTDRAAPTESDGAASNGHRARWTERLAHAFKGSNWGHLRHGAWFKRILEHHAEKHRDSFRAAHWEALYPGLDDEVRAERHVRKAAQKAAAAGVLASTCASTGELLSLVTEGLGAPAFVPAVMVSMIAEGGYTALVHLDLASDLAAMYGVPFGTDVEEMSTLFALALGQESVHHKTTTDIVDGRPPRRGLFSRLMELEDTELAAHLGKKMIEEAVLRNIVPVIGIGISARWNFVATMKFGEHVRRYVRYRRALTSACHKLHLEDVENPMLFVEGAWLLATSDGDADHGEMMAIACVADQFPGATIHPGSFGDADDEDEWLQRVANLPDAVDQRLIDLLSLVAAVDSHLAIAERRFLRRVGKVLGRSIDFDRIDRICRHLHQGEDPRLATTSAPKASPTRTASIAAN